MRGCDNEYSIAARLHSIRSSQTLAPVRIEKHEKCLAAQNGNTHTPHDIANRNIKKSIHKPTNPQVVCRFESFFVALRLLSNALSALIHI